MSLKTKILILTILPLVLVASLITVINVNQAHTLSEQEIRTFEENLLASKRRELKNYISLALTSIDHIIQDQNLDERAAREAVKQVLNGMTYGEDGYFFVYDRNGMNLVHPILNEIVGRNLYDLEDANGDFVIRSLLRIASEGGGFHRYLWNKPSSGKDEEKLSYVVQLPGWNWMMGTGLYIDDIASEVGKIRAQVNSNIRNTFFTIILIIVGTVIGIMLIAIAINLHESRLADIKLRALVHKSIRFQVSERRHFSRELHDGINQLLVSVKFRIESAINKQQKNQLNVIDDLSAGTDVLNDAIKEVRQISHDLRPRLLDDMGLSVALENLVEQFSERTGINTKMSIDLLQARLPEDIEITIYRVIQEALSNIERHAGECNVELSLRQRGGSVTLDIEDDGRGFRPGEESDADGIGLRNMQERVELLGGEFTMRSSMEQGTQLKATLSNEV